ncbi:hypothetical protein Stsp02_46840 [Streptomyces sp. NBRC 14336]|uniref:hypothetical protein n=1 Tax=Streptomyces sp. NBRC 14336 TaxID=3030992 RepID=UPI0024A59BAB|nr:hypothetical protein [Streptomyces sp. NBRC 14336]GLW49023.1 hypothetical protein Stsp02_46840 [Streptomyces sp. NBRC 14336]
MYALPERSDHTKALYGSAPALGDPVPWARLSRREAAARVRRCAGADTAGQGPNGVQEGPR